MHLGAACGRRHRRAWGWLAPAQSKRPAGVTGCARPLRNLEAPRYAADRAFRQYDASDPANRLVAGELEARWAVALARQAKVEAKSVAQGSASAKGQGPLPASFAALAEDLEAVWKDPTTAVRLKKRIVCARRRRRSSPTSKSTLQSARQRSSCAFIG